jgi:hypothetical protein
MAWGNLFSVYGHDVGRTEVWGPMCYSSCELISVMPWTLENNSVTGLAGVANLISYVMPVPVVLL